jgi:hypothetical protein
LLDKQAVWVSHHIRSGAGYSAGGGVILPVTDGLHDLIDDGFSIFDIGLFRKPDQVAAHNGGFSQRGDAIPCHSRTFPKPDPLREILVFECT